MSALAGLTVIEMAGLGPAPLAGQLLADHGASVTVIDRKPRKPDPTDINARGKTFTAIDLKSETGRAEALGLIASADILIEAFRPGVMERLGLGPDDCEAVNPRLIYARMTGWGQSGPLADTAGHDIGYLAITGALAAIGPKARPVAPLNLAADYAGGTMFLLFGVLAALYERQTSGRGQVVDAAMSDAVPLLMGLQHTARARGEWVDERESNLLDGGAPFYRTYECSDGGFIAVGPLEPQFFAALLEPLDIELDQYDRVNWPIHHERLSEIFIEKTRDEWTAIYDGTDACVAPVLTVAEAEHHPHNVARNVFERREGVLQAAPAPRLSRTPALQEPEND